MIQLWRLLFLLGFVALLSACSLVVEVDTQSGRVAGKEDDGVQQFFGIPYAAPPVGELRWAPPQPPAAWRGVRAAKTFGPWCPQSDFERWDQGQVISAPGYTLIVDVPAEGSAAEDCLTLNVWSPAKTQNNPVVVFIHGNALGSSFPLYSGRSFAESGVVFVSFNYRLLTMGNFAHPALTAASAPDQPLGNYSLLDQMAALVWVQKNIAAFGGDPKRVTLMGQSAGGASVLQLMATPKAKGLFQQAIVQSGNGWWSPIEQQKHEQFGCVVASLSGLNGCEASLEELRQHPWQKFAQTGPYSIDQRLWEQGATERWRQGASLNIPLLIGFNSADGSSLRYSPEKFLATLPPALIDSYASMNFKDQQALAQTIYTDLRTAAPARWLANQRPSGAPTWLYRFSYLLSRSRTESTGAEHAAELPYIFKTWRQGIEYKYPWSKWLPFSLEKRVLNDEDRAMTKFMHNCWVSFIKHGVPQCEGAPTWPRWQKPSQPWLELGMEINVMEGYNPEQLDSHEQAMPILFEQQQKAFDAVIDGRW